MLMVHDVTITDQYYQAFAHLFQKAGGVLRTTTPVSTNENIILYPNPTSGLVYITSNENSLNSCVDLSVFNALGKHIIEKHYNSLTNETIDFSGFSSGLYFVDVLVDVLVDGKVNHYKIVQQ